MHHGVQRSLDTEVYSKIGLKDHSIICPALFCSMNAVIMWFSTKGISVSSLDSGNDKWICSPVRSWRINSSTCRVVCSWTESVAGWHYRSPACNLGTVKLAFPLPQTAGLRTRHRNTEDCGTSMWQPVKAALLTPVHPTEICIRYSLNANRVFEIIMCYKAIRAVIRLH